MKIFISHKKEDSGIAAKIALELRLIGIPFYLDVLDTSVTKSGKELTDHIKRNLNDCTDIIVVISEATKYSQWVPFEVGMSAQKDMPTATFLQENALLPEFLEYWPRLKQPNDIKKYVSVRNNVHSEYASYAYRSTTPIQSETARFYEMLKQRL